MPAPSKQSPALSTLSTPIIEGPVHESTLIGQDVLHANRELGTVDGVVSLTEESDFDVEDIMNQTINTTMNHSIDHSNL